MGFTIRHDLEPGARFVTYFLVSEPDREKPLPTYRPKGPDKRQRTFSNSPDWFERETGKPRPKPELPSSDLPLFPGTEP